MRMIDVKLDEKEQRKKSLDACRSAYESDHNNYCNGSRKAKIMTTKMTDLKVGLVYALHENQYVQRIIILPACVTDIKVHI